MNINAKLDVTTESAPEQEGFQVVEWNVRPGATSANSDAELDSGCGCGCGIVDS